MLNKSKAQNSGWIVITWAWGLAVFMGVITSLAVTGGQAHLNPAVTIGLWAAGFLKDWTTTQILLTIFFEFVGAMLGALLVWLSYLPHWPETEDPGLKLAVFCTGPAIRNTGANLITEIVGTFMLVFGVVAIAIKFSGGLLINVQGMTGSMTVGGVLATGALPLSSIVDQGFQVQGMHMVVPKKVAVYATYGYLADKFRRYPWELSGGVSVYPSRTRSWRLNLHLIRIERSPAASNFGFYTAGQSGTTISLGTDILL